MERTELSSSSIELTIPVRFTCDECGLKHAVVNVPVRQNEEVTSWMDKTVVLVARDHDRRSPLCQSPIHKLEIPTTGRPVIGGPVVQ